MAKVPRPEFVPIEVKPCAYLNRSLPIGFNKSISQPLRVAVMTDLLELRPDDVVLEIGTGLGYQSAVLIGPSISGASTLVSSGEVDRLFEAGNPVHPLGNVPLYALFEQNCFCASRWRVRPKAPLQTSQRGLFSVVTSQVILRMSGASNGEGVRVTSRIIFVRGARFSCHIRRRWPRPCLLSASTQKRQIIACRCHHGHLRMLTILDNWWIFARLFRVIVRG
jgi:hypothetical protein